jgi:hypothetical protein
MVANLYFSIDTSLVEVVVVVVVDGLALVQV